MEKFTAVIQEGYVTVPGADDRLNAGDTVVGVVSFTELVMIGMRGRSRG